MKQHCQLGEDYQAFFGEAFFNLLNIFSECQIELPDGGHFDVRLEIIGKPSVVSRRMDYPRPVSLQQTAVALKKKCRI
jgi:hypothetical protein